LRGVISIGPGDAIFLSANASTALVQFNAQHGALAADYDIDCEIIHTVVR